MTSNSYYADFLTELNSARFQTLRPAQERILVEYVAKFEETADVAVELPTGAGKTLIALLIAEARRRNGHKVAILSANKTLAGQMLQESRDLGIPSVLMEGRGSAIPNPVKRRYQRHQSIGIMNYWVYFNQNPVIDPADLLIMDDAHLAEHCLHSLYSVEITRFVHPELFEALLSELHRRFPEYSVLADALDSDLDSNKPPELLSFIDQTLISARIKEIIDVSPALQSDSDLRFRWERMRGRVDQANIYLARDSVWIRPYVYPLISNPYYSEAKQRIYMSATIGDPGDLGRRLGIRNIKKVPVLQEDAETTFGRRLLLMNRLDEGDIPQRLGEAILSAIRIHPKSVWLCSSRDMAAKFKKLVTEWLEKNHIEGHPSWILTPEGDEVQDFKQSATGHLFVGGRFDGMDFNGDECRMVILTTLPRAINTQEEFISAYLRDSGFMRERLNQRVVQALGRCNRDDKDFAVYALADRRFATYFGLESNKADLPRNIVAELDMGQDAAEVGVSALCASVERFLSGDFSEYDAQFNESLSDVPEEKEQRQFTDTSADEVVGWSAMFWSENFPVAQRKFETCWEAAKQDGLLEIGALHGWHRAKALYLQGLQGDSSAQQKALDALDSAIQRGGRSAWFNRMRTSLNRARSASEESNGAFDDDYFAEVIRAFDDFLDQYGKTGVRFEQHCNKIAVQLQSDSHDVFLEGLETVGKMLGYTAYRPKNKKPGDADCVWRGNFGSFGEIVTYEAKIEDFPSNEIALKDLGQAHNQKTATETEYGSRRFVINGAIVTHLTELGAGVEDSLGDLRIISKQAIFDLWVKLRATLVIYRDKWLQGNLMANLQAAQSIKSSIPQTGWLTRAFEQGPAFITSEELLKAWRY